MKYFLKLTIVLLTINVAISANDNLISVVKEKYAKIKTIQGNFTQNICSEKEGTCKQFEGRFSIQRPYFSRLNVTNSEKQLIVTDTANVYIYLINKKKVYIQPASNGINFFRIFDLLLTDTSKFQITSNEDEYSALRYKKDTLDESYVFQGLKLYINNKTNLIDKFSYIDFNGLENEFQLTDIKINPNLSSKLFRFSVPKGVEVIR
jgi:outer membrane lipoprotein carrier protein